MPRMVPCDNCAPFINHSATSPVVVLRHRMSALPSPLKSPGPAIDQLAGTLPKPPPCEIEAPFISHTAVSPPVCRQAMSLLPSPLKSWVATTSSARGGGNRAIQPCCLPVGSTPSPTIVFPSAL